ncbi:MAG: SRPBCC domain-containing protein [Candidatus Promineifilaceae bacterium]
MTQPNVEDLTLTITRLFDAPVARVWHAWTDPQQIEAWFGPEGFQTRVDLQELKVGGRYIYVMIGPDGTEYPSEGAFLEIVPQEKIVATDEFGENFEPPDPVELPSGMVTTTLFEDVNGRTKVTIQIAHPTLDDKRKHEEMGVIAGWESTLDNLAGLLRQDAGA